MSPDELASAPARPAGRSRARVVWFAFAPVIGVAVPLLVWQLYVRWNDRPNVLPHRGRHRHIWGDPGFARPMPGSPCEATIGLLIGGAIALVVATVLAHSRWLERASQPWIVLFQVTRSSPTPAIVIWLSFGSHDRGAHRDQLVRAVSSTPSPVALGRQQPARAGPLGRRQPSRSCSTCIPRSPACSPPCASVGWR